MAMLTEESRVYKPFSFPWAVTLTEEHERMHWTEQEIPMGDDLGDWKTGKLTDAEREFVTQILRMFTQQDVAVGGFYYETLIPRIKNNEVRVMLGSFANREGTHQRAYALVNDTLGLPEGDYAAFLDYAQMREKAEFALEADSSTPAGMGRALAKGTFNEGVSLFASFAMLLNFQRRGLMKGMGKVVEWSIKDETKHVEGVTRLFRAHCAEHPEIVTDKFKHAIYDMAREIVRLEDNFVDLAYGSTQIEGLSANDVKTYIRFIADRRLVQLGLKPNFMVEINPIPWLDWIVSSTRHTNFFEGKVAEYEKGLLLGKADYDQLASEWRHFVVYTKAGCPWCEKAKNLLAAQPNTTFECVDLSDDDLRNANYNHWKLIGPERTMPQVFEIVGQETQRIGGYTDLSTYLQG